MAPSDTAQINRSGAITHPNIYPLQIDASLCQVGVSAGVGARPVGPCLEVGFEARRELALVHLTIGCSGGSDASLQRIKRLRDLFRFSGQFCTSPGL